MLVVASLFGGVATQCTTDGNGDGVVDVTDLLGLLGQYGGAGSYDSNGNGAVDVSDLLALLGEYGRSCGGNVCTGVFTTAVDNAYTAYASGPERSGVQGVHQNPLDRFLPFTIDFIKAS